MRCFRSESWPFVALIASSLLSGCDVYDYEYISLREPFEPVEYGVSYVKVHNHEPMPLVYAHEFDGYIVRAKLDRVSGAWPSINVSASRLDGQPAALEVSDVSCEFRYWENFSEDGLATDIGFQWTRPEENVESICNEIPGHETQTSGFFEVNVYALDGSRVASHRYQYDVLKNGIKVDLFRN